MKKAVCIIAAALSLAACTSQKEKPMETPRDILVHRLFTYAESGTIAYGHQDDLAYGHTWKVTDWENDALDRSDVKAVTGQYPMVVGFDLGDIEHGAAENLDGVPFGLIRKAALKHIERGGIVTFSWHMDNPLTGGDAWDTSSKEVVKAVLDGGEKHSLFMSWLKRGADFIESLGEDAAVILRPWHENLGSWFWWGRDLCSENDYRELFRMTWVYFTKDRGLKNIVWCYSPNGPINPEDYMSRYPGDDFVDVLGTDIYEYTGGASYDEAGARFAAGVKDMLNTLAAISYEHRKLLCFSETGLEGIPDMDWWTGVLEPAMKDYPVSYVLTWRNAHDKAGHFYAPWEGFEGAEDFVKFSRLDNILFLENE